MSRSSEFSFDLLQGLPKLLCPLFKVCFVNNSREYFLCVRVEEHNGRRRVVRIGRVQGVINELQHFVVLLIGVHKNQNGSIPQGKKGMERGASRVGQRNS